MQKSKANPGDLGAAAGGYLDHVAGSHCERPL